MAATLVALLAATLSASGEARADAAGDKLLAAMDAALNRAQTLTFEYEVVNQEPGNAEGKLAMSVRVKGDKWLGEFSAPADMKGTKALILSSTQIYVYLPAFGKVRRMTSQAADQSFLGLAFSMDDMATTSYGGAYTAQIASETATAWKLVATPKGGQATTYSRIELLVNKDKTVPSEIKYFNTAGTNIKTETRTAYGCEGNICSPGERKMVDNAKGHWTKLIRKSWKVNETISDDLFSSRSLGQ
jgi:outer membrane lipoprotein-sorting protein